MIGFVIAGVVLVVAAVVVASVTALRSREARSDWLGELSDIRRSSLGDDEEVTGAIAAIPTEVGDDADDWSAAEAPNAESVAGPTASDTDVLPTTPEDSATPAPEESEGPEDSEEPRVPEAEGPEEPRVSEEESEDPDADDDLGHAPAGDGDGSATPEIQDLTDLADRTFEDGGTRFAEHRLETGGVLRTTSDSEVLPRVMATVVDGTTRAVAVDLVAGQAWVRIPDPETRQRTTIRTPVGWVTLLPGVHMVLADGDGWSYVMCLEGACSLQVTAAGDAGDAPLVLGPGDIGRGRPGEGFQRASVGVEALDSEGVVRRHRRLDRDGGHLGN